MWISLPVTKPVVFQSRSFPLRSFAFDTGEPSENNSPTFATIFFVPLIAGLLDPEKFGMAMVYDFIEALVTGLFEVGANLFTGVLEVFLFFPDPRSYTGLLALHDRMVFLYVGLVFLTLLGYVVNFQLFPFSAGYRLDEFLVRAVVTLIAVILSRDLLAEAILTVHALGRYLFPENFTLTFAATGIEEFVGFVVGSTFTYLIALAILYVLTISSIVLFIAILGIRALLVYTIWALFPLLMAMWLINIGPLRYSNQIAKYTFTAFSILLAVGFLVSGILGAGASIAGFQPNAVYDGASAGVVLDGPDRGGSASSCLSGPGIGADCLLYDIALRLLGFFGSIIGSIAIIGSVFGFLVSIGGTAPKPDTSNRSSAKARNDRGPIDGGGGSGGGPPGPGPISPWPESSGFHPNARTRGRSGGAGFATSLRNEPLQRGLDRAGGVVGGVVGLGARLDNASEWMVKRGKDVPLVDPFKWAGERAGEVFRDRAGLESGIPDNQPSGSTQRVGDGVSNDGPEGGRGFEQLSAPEPVDDPVGRGIKDTSPVQSHHETSTPTVGTDPDGKPLVVSGSDIPTHLDPSDAIIEPFDDGGRHSITGRMLRGTKPDGSILYLKQPGAFSTKTAGQMGANAVLQAAAAREMDLRTCEVWYDSATNWLVQRGVDGELLEDASPDLIDYEDLHDQVASTLLVGNWDVKADNFVIDSEGKAHSIDLDETGSPLAEETSLEREERSQFPYFTFFKDRMTLISKHLQIDERKLVQNIERRAQAIDEMSVAATMRETAVDQFGSDLQDYIEERVETVQENIRVARQGETNLRKVNWHSKDD